jgi:hypothetical protein
MDFVKNTVLFCDEKVMRGSQGYLFKIVNVSIRTQGTNLSEFAVRSFPGTSLYSCR